MKSLELNQMEKLQGGDAGTCAVAVGLAVVVGIATIATGGLFGALAAGIISAAGGAASGAMVGVGCIE